MWNKKVWSEKVWNFNFKNLKRDKSLKVKKPIYFWFSYCWLELKVLYEDIFVWSSKRYNLLFKISDFQFHPALSMLLQKILQLSDFQENKMIHFTWLIYFSLIFLLLFFLFFIVFKHSAITFCVCFFEKQYSFAIYAFHFGRAKREKRYTILENQQKYWVQD